MFETLKNKYRHYQTNITFNQALVQSVAISVASVASAIAVQNKVEDLFTNK